MNDQIGSKNKKFKYKKNSQEMFSILNKFGNQEMAIKWAKDLDDKITGQTFAHYNPNTLVYKLVEELLGKSKDLNDELNEKYNLGK